MMDQLYCPNRHKRLPERLVDYDELVYSIFSSQATRPGMHSRSYNWRSQHGKVSLCAPCAARYKRMVWLRTTGWKIANPAIAILILGSLFFAIVITINPGLRNGVGIYLAALPVYIGAAGVAIGCSLALAARLMRSSATRFLKPASYSNFQVS